MKRVLVLVLLAASQAGAQTYQSVVTGAQIDSTVLRALRGDYQSSATAVVRADTATWLPTWADVNTALALKANLASPTFTGTPLISTDTVATRAYARSVGVASGFSWSVSGSSAKQDSLRFIAGTNISLTQTNNTVEITAGDVDIADSAAVAYKAYRDGSNNIISSTYLSTLDTTTSLLTIGDAAATYAARADTGTWLVTWADANTALALKVTRADTATWLPTWADVNAAVVLKTDSSTYFITRTQAAATYQPIGSYLTISDAIAGYVRKVDSTSYFMTRTQINTALDLKASRADTATWLPTWADIITQAYAQKADTATWLATWADINTVRGVDTARAIVREGAKADSTDNATRTYVVAQIGSQITDSAMVIELGSSSTLAIINATEDTLKRVTLGGNLALSGATLYADTGTGKLATNADLVALTLDGLSNVLTTGKQAGNSLTWNGTNWVDSTGASDSARAAGIADSLRNKSFVAFDTSAYSTYGANNRLYLNATLDTIKVGAYSGDTTSLSARIDLKVTRADTATWLPTWADIITQAYAQKADTASWLPTWADINAKNYLTTAVDTAWFAFAFGAGAGNAADTAAISTSAKYGAFYNARDTLKLTNLRVVMMHGIGTDTLNWQISWDDSLNGTAVTNLNTSSLPCNSIAGGTEDAAFDNAQIPPGVWVWAHSPAVVTGRKPTMVMGTLTGWRKKP